MRFYDLQSIISSVFNSFKPTMHTSIINAVMRAAHRRHERFYGNTSKYKPHECKFGSRQHLRYIRQGHGNQKVLIELGLI